MRNDIRALFRLDWTRDWLACYSAKTLVTCLLPYRYTLYNITFLIFFLAIYFHVFLHIADNTVIGLADNAQVVVKP